jgi:hypothetical protein
VGRHSRPPSWGLKLWRPDPEPIELAEAPPPPGVQDQQLIQDLSVALAEAATPAAVAKILSDAKDVAEAAIRALLQLGGIERVLRRPHAVRPDAPIQAQARQNWVRSAAYLLNATRRLSTAVLSGQRGALKDALAKERMYLDQHVQATIGRENAAQAVADAYQKAHQARIEDNQRAAQSGAFFLPASGPTMLGWYAQMDDRTSPECRAANGKNFDPVKPPLIGYPGAVHPTCRCKPGPAHRGADLLAGSPAPRPQAVALSAPQQLTVVVDARRKAQTAIELTKSAAYPDLERVPGKQNWVDKAGGLPDFIERIAKHLHYEKGMEIGRAIAVAVNTCRRWAAGGQVTEHGSDHGVTAKTRAQAAAAIAEWEAKKASSKG